MLSKDAYFYTSSMLTSQFSVNHKSTQRKSIQKPPLINYLYAFHE